MCQKILLVGRNTHEIANNGTRGQSNDDLTAIVQVHCSVQIIEMAFSWNSTEQRESKKLENEKQLKSFLLHQQEEVKQRY